MKTITKTLTAVALLSILSACSSGGSNSNNNNKAQNKPPVVQPQMNGENQQEENKKPQQEQDKKPQQEENKKPEQAPETKPLPPTKKPDLQKPQGDQAKPQNPEDRYSFGFKDGQDKLKLDITLYKKDNKNGSSSINDKQPIDTVEHLDLRTEKHNDIVEPQDGDYYLTSLGGYSNGYVGYYVEPKYFDDNKKLYPHFLVYVNKDKAMTPSQKLNATYEKSNGFSYVVLKDNNGFEVSQDHIKITFKDGKVDTDSYVKVNTLEQKQNPGRYDKVFDLSGDVNKITFTADPNNIRGVGKDKKVDTDRLIFSGDKSKTPQHIVGHVKSGDKVGDFEGVFKAEKTK